MTDLNGVTVYQPENYSWQFKLINLIFKLPFKNIIQNPDKILSRRKYWALINHKFKINPQAVCDPIIINTFKAEWITPIKGDDLPIVLYLHGGGFCAGSIETHRIYLSHFSVLTQTRVLCIDYRLAPEHPYPAALEDALTAYYWLLHQGISSQRLFIAGESAGGGLALSLILKLRDTKAILPRACIALSPWADLCHQGASFIDNNCKDIVLNAPALPKAAAYYAQQNDLCNPYISPVYAHYDNLCPILIHAGTHELIFSDAVTIIKKIKVTKGNVDYELWNKLFHAWHYSAGFLPEAKQAIVNIKNYISDQLKN